MKTSLLLRRVITGTAAIGSYAIERQCAHDSSDPRRHRALLRRFLNPCDSISSILPNLAAFSVNHELPGSLFLECVLSSVDSRPLRRKRLSGLAFLLYCPSSVGTIYMNRLRRHELIVDVLKPPQSKISLLAATKFASTVSKLSLSCASAKKQL